MTAFVKENFLNDHEYVNYLVDGDWKKRTFVARFKYQKGAKGSFIKFLMKNFSVEEYFARIDSGESPLKIVESKGYLMPHIKKILKNAGYETTPAGFAKYIDDSVKARHG